MSRSRGTLVGQAADPSRLARGLAELGLASGAVLGARQEVPPDAGCGVAIRSLPDPWLLERRAERLEEAYALSRSLIGALAGSPGVDLARWQIEEGLLHDLMYYCVEDWVLGRREAETLLEYAAADPGLAPPFHLLPAPGVRGLACAARLASSAETTVLASAAAGSGTAARRGSALLLGQARRWGWRRLPAGWRGDGILFVEVYANRLLKSRLLLERLQQEGCRPAVLSLATRERDRAELQAAAGELGLPLLPWDAALGQLGLARLAARLGLVAAAGGRIASFVREALRQQDLEDVRLAVAVLGHVLRSAARMLLVREVLDGAFRLGPPRLVLTARGDDTILRVLGRVAEGHGVPVVDLQHGLKAGVIPAIHRDIPWVHFALDGEGSRLAYAAAGIPDTRLHAVGSPDHDMLRCEARGPLPEGVAPPYVLYSSSATTLHKRWDPADPHQQTLAALDAYLAQAPAVQLVVKLHPQEHGQETAALVARMQHRERVVVVQGVPNAPLYAQALAQVSVGSTSSVEAALLGTPAFLLDVGGFAATFEEAVRSGAVCRVVDPAALPAALLACGEGRPARENGPVDRARFEEYYAHRFDGRAVERILGLPALRAARSRGGSGC